MRRSRITSTAPVIPNWATPRSAWAWMSGRSAATMNSVDAIPVESTIPYGYHEDAAKMRRREPYRRTAGAYCIVPKNAHSPRARPLRAPAQRVRVSDVGHHPRAAATRLADRAHHVHQTRGLRGRASGVWSARTGGRVADRGWARVPPHAAAERAHRAGSAARAVECGHDVTSSTPRGHRSIPPRCPPRALAQFERSGDDDDSSTVSLALRLRAASLVGGRGRRSRHDARGWTPIHRESQARDDGAAASHRHRDHL